MIKERYVNLEVANLLRDKGFDWKCEHYYNVANDNPYSNANYRLSYPKPTQQIACDWVLEKYKIYINVSFVSGKGYVGIIYEISDFNEAFDLVETKYYSCIEPVYNDALQYVLTNFV